MSTGRRKESACRQAAKICFSRAFKGCTRMNRSRNDNITEELHILPVKEIIKRDKKLWKQHFHRMVEGWLSSSL